MGIEGNDSARRGQERETASRSSKVGGLAMRPFRTQANRASACRFPRTMLARPARAGQESPRPLDSATLVEAQSRGQTRQAAPRQCALATQVRGVAQPGRAPGSGPGGRRFKSSLPDQCFQWFANQRSRPTGISPGGLVPEGASILGFSPNIGCKTIYKNIYSRKQ